jgi:hypothetical protein
MRVALLPSPLLLPPPLLPPPLLLLPKQLQRVSQYLQTGCTMMDCPPQHPTHMGSPPWELLDTPLLLLLLMVHNKPAAAHCCSPLEDRWLHH